MANKMLIDASHPEETRVVVLRGSRVEEFDFESARKKQLRGNIYLAKVTRVEPSLQAAFVDYGGNRHGFLAFSEIHPDYYQIPVVDRQALIEEEAKAQRDEEDDEAGGQRRSRRFRRDKSARRAEKRSDDGEILSEPYGAEDASAEAAPQSFEAEASSASIGEGAELHAGREAELEAEQTFSREAFSNEAEAGEDPGASFEASIEDLISRDDGLPAPEKDGAPLSSDAEDASDDQLGIDFAPEGSFKEEPPADAADAVSAKPDAEQNGENEPQARTEDRRGDADEDAEDEDEQVEQLGGDAMEEVLSRPRRYRKQYKIQEVIKRRQVLLVQVVKEERGNKGAALTTYLSLAGRYSVLMPNTARGGGISRKITDSTDRQRLKSIAQELEVPEGMGVILRTAGAMRTKAEVKRDFEYLLRMWETVRETTLKSTAPTLVYEEGSLIKRAIRDLYNKDIDDVVVAGEKGFREARDFMRLLMPSHVRSVQPYRDPQPIFSKSGVEAQLDAMFLNHVTLKSGGYIVINQTEALVAIDVNSGRSTREHNIEDTALRTNLEAADEVARQLRLRDLAGLIVVDFIDMEESRNNRAVERRLKDALKNDRARIQIGRISHFGLLEMSRQRIRTGVLEGSTEICPHCSGSGMLRSTASIALHVLRVAEDALIKSASHDLVVKTRSPVALYILNEKRGHLRDLERRFGAGVTIGADDSLIGGIYHALERGEPASGGHEPLAPSEAALLPVEEAFDDAALEFDGQDLDSESVLEKDDEAEAQDGRREGESEADSRRRRRRRRRRGRGADREGSGIAANAPQPPDDALEIAARIGGLEPAPLGEPLFEEPSPFDDTGEDEQEAEVAVELDSAADEAEPAAAALDADLAPAPEEAGAPAKERRRPRRSAKARSAAAEPADQAPELALDETTQREAGGEEEADAAPAKRGRRTPRARTPRRAATAASVEAQAVEGDSAPESAPAPAAEEPITQGRASEPAEQPSSSEQGGGASEAPPATSPAWEAAAAEPAPPPQEDPSRPKRSGWWQRAKASLSR